MLTKNTVTQSLLIYSDMVVFWGANIRTKPHAHHALEIVLSYESSLTVIHKEQHFNAKGIILKANVKHETFGQGSAIFIYFDPESHFARKFNILLKELHVIPLADEIALALMTFLENGMREGFSETSIKDYLLDVFFHPEPLYPINSSVDERIGNVISYIQTNLGRTTAMKELTERACLSESRLFHLFKAEIGIPIRKYILWCRVRKALQLVIDGCSLTQAAKRSGFADLAHLNRTFVSFFGASPSHFLKSTL
ncbi:MAG: helix-turn-helix domain-containing protein [Chryseolinea sp.]